MHFACIKHGRGFDLNTQIHPVASALLRIRSHSEPVGKRSFSELMDEFKAMLTSDDFKVAIDDHEELQYPVSVVMMQPSCIKDPVPGNVHQFIYRYASRDALFTSMRAIFTKCFDPMGLTNLNARQAARAAEQ